MNTRTTLVTGASAAIREATICALISASATQDRSAVILEGLANGQDPFALLDARTLPQIVRIAPGCLCCSGNLTMRVTLNRVLRQRPSQLYISLANSLHLTQIEAFLSTPTYTQWLTLTASHHCDEAA